MEGTLKDFKAHAKECADEYEVDQLCFNWLKMSCMEKADEHAADILRVVENMIR